MTDWIDLRSDTVTRPTLRMRRAMAEADVGDDVYDEDPTVHRLQAAAAERLGFEAALFVPTGSMGNEIAIHLQTRPGDDVLTDDGSHVYNYELGAMGALSGVVPRIVPATAGRIAPADLARAIAPKVEYMAPSRLLVLENSHNHAGGRVLDLADKDRLLEVARRGRLAVHLDGARVFNAATTLGRSAAELAAGFDSVMFCLSKGLGAPIGSILCGDAAFIAEARVARKRFGGGMRQVGVLAAAGLVALEHVERLADDHDRAARLAQALAELPPFELDPADVETNIVIAGVRPPWTVDRVIETLRAGQVLAGPMGPGRIRFVTHLDVGDEALERALAVLRSLPSRP